MPPPRVDPIREIFRDRSFAILEAVCSSEILCRNDILHPSFSKRRSHKVLLAIYFRLLRIAFWLSSTMIWKISAARKSFLMKESCCAQRLAHRVVMVANADKFIIDATGDNSLT
jgi:hypothetical protein